MPSKKTATTWSDVKANLIDFDRAGLLGLLQDPSTLDKLAGAPIDPMKLMKMLDEDGQQRAPQAPMPQGSRGLGQVSAPSTLAFDPRAGLSTFLGK